VGGVLPGVQARRGRRVQPADHLLTSIRAPVDRAGRLALLFYVFVLGTLFNLL
jgi:hypothetical protein